MAVDMAKGMGVMFAISGAMSAIGSSFSQAMEYQNTMKTAQAILQHGTDTYSPDAFKNMEYTVRDVGVKTKFSAPEVANAARFLAMAGMDINAINTAIRPIADLALIGDTDLGETADKMTNIMTIFGYDSKALAKNPNKVREFANVMTTTATRSNTDLMMLAESAKYGGGVAHMYGGKDPNLFADTMALFGVMGNAGIQGSSAGTALRMMYQNIFKPNKNQTKVLDKIEEYGVKRFNKDGSKRAMSEIILDIANKLPEKDIPDIVGSLFRITAQPGASASIMAATRENQMRLAGMAQEDGSSIEEAAKGMNELANQMNSKAGMSALASLMIANRNSITGNISGEVAEEKQNTISGLWAQVTSTFTEGIVKAFENRQGGFEEILKNLRDYLAKPETVRMLQNLLDLVIEIGKVMAWFVKLWADLYNLAPGLIKTWVTVQMAFTQLGSLISPLTQLTGALNRLKSMIFGFAGMPMASARRAAARGVASGALASSIYGAPLVVGVGKHGAKKRITGAAAMRANKQLRDNAFYAALLALGGSNMTQTHNSLNQATLDHYNEVRRRANNIYGRRHAGRAFMRNWKAFPTAASFATSFANVKKLFFGAITSVAKAFGLLLNPITVLVGSIAGLAYLFNKLGQRLSGKTDAQKEAVKKAKAAGITSREQWKKDSEWYDKIGSEYIIDPMPTSKVQVSQTVETHKKNKDQFQKRYALIFNDLQKDASEQGIWSTIKDWRDVLNSNPNSRIAMGDKYADYAGDNVAKWKYKYGQSIYSGNQDWIGLLRFTLNRDKMRAKELQERMIQGALMTAGADDPVVQQAMAKIAELQQQYLEKRITLIEFQARAAEIRDNASQYNPNSPNSRWIDASGMTMDQFTQMEQPVIYSQYHEGIYNMLNNEMMLGEGSKTARMQANFNLSKHLFQDFTEQWYENVNKIIGDYQILHTVISPDGKKMQDIAIKLQLNSKGKIDFSNVLKQVMAQCDWVTLTLNDFYAMSSAIYKILYKLGYVKSKEVKDIIAFNREYADDNRDVTEREAGEYWDKYIAPDSNSRWLRSGWTRSRYAKHMANSQLPDPGINLRQANGTLIKTWAKSERLKIKSRANHEAADAAAEELKNLEQMNPFSQNSNNSGGTSTPTTPKVASDQSGYASNYDRAAAKPTQVVINVNELCHFDRTAIASSAEQRDMMAAMQEQITNSVYQLFATAANQVKLQDQMA